MAKKDKKDSGKKVKAAAGALEAVEAVRGAVERTFAVTAGAAQSTREYATDVPGGVAEAANRIQEVLGSRVLAELRSLRGDVEALSRRVEALESTPAPAPARRAATGTRRSAATTGRAEAGTRRSAATTERAASSRASAADVAGSGRGRGRKAPAKTTGADADARRTASRTTGPRRAGRTRTAAPPDADA